MKIFAYISGAAAIISLVLAVVARFSFFDKSLFNIHALTFLRVTIVMLLFAIAFLLFEIAKKS